MEAVKESRVLIVGAGVCGLAIAQGLTKEGISCTIFERDSESNLYNRPRDWGVGVHWGREFLLPLLPQELQENFPKAVLVDSSCKSDEPIPHLDGSNGQTLAQITMPGMMRASRRKLRQWLTSNDVLDIKFCKRLVGIRVSESTVLAEFEDRTCEKGRMIIGCDGSRSKVREWLVGADKAKVQDTGMVIMNHAYKGYSAEQALLMRKIHPIAMLGYLPDLHGQFLLAALDVPDPKDPAGWTFQVNHTWWGSPGAAELQDSQARLKLLKERCAKMCEPFRTMGLGLDENTKVPADPAVQWVPIPWDNRNGMVTLAGDAAHPMLPRMQFRPENYVDADIGSDRGQGLNSALRDANYLVDAVKRAVLGGATLKETITIYEEEMRTRGAQEVHLSLESARKTTIATLRESPIVKHNLNSIKA